MKVRRILSSAAALSVLAMVGLAGSPSSVLAQTEEADQVLSYETVFGSLEADGTLRNVRLVNDLRIIGEGDIVVTDPTSTDDFRTLSGFAEPELSDGQATYTVEGLDGEAQFVTASTPDQPPPVSMAVTYYLDGERIEADELVGQSGRVQIVFDVSNDSGESQELTYEDGDGNEHTFVEEVPIPMVAQLTLELPADHFTNIEAPDAEQVVDPRGNITALWNLVMIPPIGSTVQSPEIVMDAEEFEMGAVRLVSVPVAPETREFLAFAEEEFAGGEERASGLYSGATELSDSIDQLHDGTLELADGMERLFDGSRELAAGLGEAFSGSGELAAGLGLATSGSGELTAGLGTAQSGSGRITGGLGQLRGGLLRIGGGLDQLAAGLPEGRAGAQEIAEAAAGIQQIVAGLASAMTDIADGASDIAVGADQIQTGAGTIQTGAGGISAKAGGITTMANGISATCTAIGATCTGTQIDELAASIVDCATGTGGSCGGGGSIQGIAGAIQTGAGTIAAGAGQISAGGLQIEAGANAVQACLVGGGSPCSGNPSVSAIAGLIRGGAMQLAAGIGDAISGVGRLSSGVGEAVDGTTQLFQGSSELTAGLAEGAAGSAQLTAGLVEATTGAGLLNAGLGEAAAGSGRLSDGIGEAQDGAKQIEQGVYSVNELGVKEIARGANDTAAELARSLALMEAQDERAATEAFTYGPPSSDQAETVVGGSGYVLTMDQLDGRQEDSTARGIAVGVGFLALIGMGILGARSLSRSPS